MEQAGCEKEALLKHGHLKGTVYRHHSDETSHGQVWIPLSTRVLIRTTVELQHGLGNDRKASMIGSYR